MSTFGRAPAARPRSPTGERFQRSLGAAMADNVREQLEPIIPPADLRGKVLASAHADPRPAQPVQSAQPADNVVDLNSRRRRLAPTALLALAAVFALVAVGLGVVFVRDQSARLDTAQIEHRG